MYARLAAFKAKRMMNWDTAMQENYKCSVTIAQEVLEFVRAVATLKAASHS